jgi:diguanylate cyclase (GGDEF)-like protein/PAS domain S-box-containing protein
VRHDSTPPADHGAGPFDERRLLEVFLQSTPDQVYFKDEGGRFITVSDQQAKRFGFERAQDVVGKTDFDMFTDEHAAQAFGDEQRIIATGEAIIGFEERETFPDGRSAWVRTSKLPIRADDGTVIGTFGISRDITAQRAAEESLAAAEHESRTVLELSGDMHARSDADGCFTYVSPNSEQIVGYHAGQMLGRLAGEFVHPDDLPLLHGISRAVRTGGVAEVDLRVPRPDGRCVWVHVLLRARYDERGRVSEIVHAVRDISERKAQEAQLREARARFEQAFEHAPIGMALQDRDGRFLKVNRELCRFTGYREQQLAGRTFAEITHPDDAEGDRRALRELLDGARESCSAEKRYLHADGHVIWVTLSVSAIRDESGEVRHFVAQTQDITERRAFQERLQFLADHDPLTDLYNRRRFESELDRQVQLSRRDGETAALVMLDLDHFKYLNDSLGHSVGDRVIAHVGAVLRGRLRRSDILARIGGDEFALILPHTDAHDARWLAEELIIQIEADAFCHDQHRYTLSASAGIVILDRDIASAEDALVNADIALYDAKRSGRNRLGVHRPEGRQDVLAGLSWSQLLKDALAQERFVLYGQPIVDLSNGKTVRHELLLRMLGADGEVIAPMRFLPAAVRFGFMPRIDRWVIAQAAELAGACPGRGLAVNLASTTIAERGLVAFIAAELERTGADPADVSFEISEADVIANLDHARVVCEQLRALGCEVALDDFGSGFSGFSYLKALTVDVLKIDGQFVKELHENRLDLLVVEAVQHVADGLGLPTVAEYVPDRRVAQLLSELGVSYGQGYYLGRPEPFALADAMRHVA